MNNNNNNNNTSINSVVVCVRDGLCGVGGIHCFCCRGDARHNHGRRDPSFSGRVRSALRDFVARDLRNNPF